MKLSQTLAALALMGSASTALADTYTLELNSVELNATKADGKAWDAKVPLKKDSELPDVIVEVSVKGEKKLLTAVAKDSLSVTFSDQKVVLPVGEAVTVKVWDKDIKDNDSIAEISFQPSADEIKAGALSKSQGGVAALKVSLTSNAVEVPPAPAPAPAPAEEPAPAPAPAEEPAPAPAPAEEPAPAPAEEPAAE